MPATSPIVLDGKLNEEVWQQAPASTSSCSAILPRAAAVQRTERASPSTRRALCGVRAFDTEPDSIVGMLTRRDQRSPSDWIRIVVDSYFDRRSAYEFGVNPVGVKTDRYYFNDGEERRQLGCGVGRRGRRATPTAGRAEFRIPFSQLRFNNTAAARWASR